MIVYTKRTIFKNIYFILTCVRARTRLGLCAQGSQKRASDALELELEVVVRCPMWVLRTKSGSSGIAVSAVH